MVDGKNQKTKTGDEEKQKKIPKFQIKVENKFDYPTEVRSIRIRHSPAEGYVVLPAKKRKCDDPPMRSTEDWPKLEYELTPDPEDSLIIELDDEAGVFTNDVYIELPFIADYELYWEIKKDDKEKMLARPITKIIRDTGKPKTGKPKRESKTVIVIPADQSAWKLKINSPQNMLEHLATKNLVIEYLEKSNGQPDSVSVGDNGEG